MGKTELMKGSTEMVILAQLAERTMYGYELAKQIELRSEGYLRFGEGTLYPALKRLEQEGCVSSEWRPSTDGPRRKYYTVTRAGLTALHELKAEWNLFQRTISQIVGGAGHA